MLNSRHSCNFRFFLLSLLQQLPAHDRYIQTPVFQRNSYFAHSENILLAAVVDENKEVRRNAITKIIDCRQSESLLRQFNIPQSLNINASNYIEMIDWEKEAIHPPPILQEITDDDLGCDPCGLYCKSRAAGLFSRAAGPKRAEKSQKDQFYK